MRNLDDIGRSVQGTEAVYYLAVAWWAATIPGLATMTAVLSINIVGDWLRDRLDPKLQT